MPKDFRHWNRDCRASPAISSFIQYWLRNLLHEHIHSSNHFLAHGYYRFRTQIQIFVCFQRSQTTKMKALEVPHTTSLAVILRQPQICLCIQQSPRTYIKIRVYTRLLFSLVDTHSAERFPVLVSANSGLLQVKSLRIERDL